MPSWQLFADAQGALQTRGQWPCRPRALMERRQLVGTRGPFSLPTHVTRQAIRFTKAVYEPFYLINDINFLLYPMEKPRLPETNEEKPYLPVQAF